MAGYTDSVRNAWKIIFTSGESITSYEAYDIIGLITSADPGTVVSVRHDVIVWRRFVDAKRDFLPGELLSSVDVSDAFTQYKPSAFNR